jgi:hypothetical protein
LYYSKDKKSKSGRDRVKTDSVEEMSLGIGTTADAELDCNLLDEQLGIDGREGQSRNDEDGERSAMPLAR